MPFATDPKDLPRIVVLRAPSFIRSKSMLPRIVGYDPSQPRDDAGRWTGGGDSMAPDRGDGSGAQGTSPSERPAMPVDKFSKFVRDEHKFKDKIVVEFTNGRKFIGRSTSKAMDGTTILVRGKFEGTKGRKTELQAVSAAITHRISIHGKDDEPLPDQQEPGERLPPQSDQDDEPATTSERLPKLSTPKAGIPTPSAKYTKPLIAEQDKNLEAYAEHAGKSVEALKGEWQAKVESAVAKAKVYVAMPPEVLENVLHEGRYKSQFETNASFGGDVQIEERQHAEHVIFGTPKNIADKDRAVYGYASQEPPSNRHKGDMPSNNHESCMGYGSVIVQYKDEVKERATITFGDSLNHSDTAIPSPMNSPSFRSANFSRWNDETDPPPVVKHGSVDAQAIRNDDERGGDYTEVQVHGGLSVSEIDTVWLRKAPTGRTADLLQKRGVKWQLME